jgi:hypothetical protein
VALDLPPAPVVTIVDPVHPGTVHDVVVAPTATRPRRLRPRERLVLALLLAVLAVALAAARDLRTSQRQTAQLAALHLVAIPSAGGPVLGSHPRMTVVLRLAGDGQLALPLRRFAAEGGWRPLGIPPRAFAVGQEVGLRHDLSCEEDLRLPAGVTLWVDLDGDERVLHVPVARHLAPGGLLDLTAVCGALPASEAVVLSSSSVTARGPRAEVLLRLVNTGVDDATVWAVRYPGFAFRATTPMPLRLAGRARAPLSYAELVEHPLLLDAQVAACGPARAALDDAEQSGAPDLLEVTVQGGDARATTHLDVPGLESFLAQAWVLTCGGP